MQVQVKLYATLVRYSHGKRAGESVELELPAGANLADLYRALNIPDGEVRQAFVNGLVQAEDFRLKPGDEVGIFPPIGGG
jgi:molybdopterin synthase sulfur carrier subunit